MSMDVVDCITFYPNGKVKSTYKFTDKFYKTFSETVLWTIMVPQQKEVVVDYTVNLANNEITLSDGTKYALSSANESITRSITLEKEVFSMNGKVEGSAPITAADVKNVNTQKPIEARYTALGTYKISYTEFDSENDTCKKYEIWYPTEMKQSSSKYPLVVIANGTGVPASKYKDVFKHLASWGFIVVGNEDENSRTGASSSASLDFMLKLNKDSGSDFFGKIDVDHIGIGGHSQGGVGTINAVTNQGNHNYYKAMYTASATSGFWGQKGSLGTEWSYDVSKVNIPYLMVAGTGIFDAGTAKNISEKNGQGICPLWSLNKNYSDIPNTVTKIMARRVNADHGDMLYQSNGYMTAWFMYWLKDDTQAGTAFFGDNAEILTNANWQDVMKNH